ncbi:GATOR complex protein Iml1 [Lepeophtheirus salmonis]|nr:GATOR complex protein Iml1-like [Lepeophtheirus salmonis]
MTKTWKLSTFPKTFSDQEILLSPIDFPDLHPNDVVEVYHTEDEEEEQACKRLILEVQESSLNHTNSGGSSVCSGNAVYIAKEIAEAFGLRNYEPVRLRRLKEDEIPKLESLEVIFKEEYLGRSEMWRLKNHLLTESRCLHILKRINFSGIWITVERLKGPGGVLQACGVVTPETKVIFRSLSAMVYLYIQMSSEMWGGNDYFDKIVDGFLSELFERWVQQGCVHDVTIVLFSRCYYTAHAFEDFPEEMRSCVIKKNDGRFYEDFYRVIIQNERFTDWRPTLVQLRNIFPTYKKSLLDYHKSKGTQIPEAYISSASEGNFLEVINMSLNTFDNHYHNRNLDRTGQQTIVITPGVGVYTVDRELSLITKRRIIDSGVGSDLLCVGEQPLHSVPLFKFQSHDDKKGEYGIPHWIHLSFYTSNRSTLLKSNFIPRIKVPYDIVPDGITKPFMPGGTFDHIDPKSSDFFEQYDDFQFKKLPIPEENADNVRPGLLLFDPESKSKRITSNRRRWTHIFSEYSSSSVLNCTMGVDWKSLTTPASLPITTDYLPDSKDIELNYVFNEYSLNPDEINDNSGNSGSSVKCYCDNMEVFRELISQRLAQGFQIVEFPSEKIKNSFIKQKTVQQLPHIEFWLSIGQIYHKVSLSANMQTIHVTRYSPITPVNTSNHSYKYRFQAPDNDIYEVSWVEFNTQKLENFNWNHMDYYVCTRGDRDFILTESLKYWRFRMHIMPLTSFIPYTKKIKDGISKYCDIYECLDIHNCVREGFLKFAETCLNNIRRSKKSGCVYEKSSIDKEDVVQYLKSKLTYLNKQATLPSSTFIAAEAIQYLLELRKIDLNKKQEIVAELDGLRQHCIIQHASGDPNVPFNDGFVLFYFVDEDSETYYHGDVEAFHNEWVEIQFSADKISNSLLEKTINKYSKEWNPTYRSVTLNIDTNNKSDRQEWGHLKYQTHVDSDSAFEVTLQWSVATGALVSELVHGWSRKGQQMYGLFIIPVPSDPFALPVTPNSDPVRGPIFIELNTEFWKTSPSLLEEDNFTLEQRTFLFRETIARRFGFIPCYNQQRSSSIFSTHHQYIHCTGNCFLLIPTQLKLNTGIQGYRDSVVSNSNENLEGTYDQTDFRPLYDHSKTGFIWSWNFMISRRWKMMSNTGATGSILFMDKLLSDFRSFCRNEDGRLQNFWNECWK